MTNVKDNPRSVRLIIQLILLSSVLSGIQLEKLALKMLNWLISFCIVSFFDLINSGGTNMKTLIKNNIMLVFKSLLILINRTHNNIFNVK